MKSQTLIHVDDLEVRFDTPEGTIHAVNGVTLSVTRGETLAIVGESGSGKSVTVLALLRLLAEPPARISSGTATLEATYGVVNLLQESQRELRRVRGAEIGFIAQDPMSSLNPTVRISTQMVDMIRTHLGLSKREARRRAIGLLERVGIPDAAGRVDAYPHEFSGGMRQRVMIAIAVSCDPQLVIADEPTTALDVTVQAQIADLMRELRDELGLSLIWMTHDLGVVAGLADRVGVMYAGRLVEISDVDGLYDRPLHPYTIGLLDALPKIGEKADRLKSIPGLPPDLTEAPTHCPFAARCPHAFARCRNEIPPLIEPMIGRHVACFYDVEKGEPRAMSEMAVTTAPGREPVLRVVNMTKHFPGVSRDKPIKAVDGISFELFPGETLGLVGESGCGKSTTGRAVLQLHRPTSGHVWLGDVELTALGEEELRVLRPRMQMIFQDSYASLNPRHTIGRIIGEPMRVHTSMTKAEISERVVELLDLVGLRAAHRTRYPHEFSGGQRQRINIARALALSPDLIVCDEPISALDVSIQAQVINLFADLQDELGIADPFVAHDLSMVEHISDRVAVMYLGHIVELAGTEEMFDNPLHPYTQALLSAVPVPDPRTEAHRRRVPLEGEVPSPASPPPGCVFSTRCPLAIDRCRTESPELREVTSDHWAACHLADLEGSSIVELGPPPRAEPDIVFGDTGSVR